MEENKLIKFERGIVKHVSDVVGITNKLLKHTPTLDGGNLIDHQSNNRKTLAMLLIKKQVIQARQWRDHKLHSQYNFVGENNKHIVILTNTFSNKNSTIDLFYSILKACKLELSDVAIINTEKKEIELTRIMRSFSPEIILLFGMTNTYVKPALDLNVNQVFTYEGCKILSTYNALDLIGHPSRKMELWIVLKRVFDL